MIGTRHAIVHEGTGQKLPVITIDGVFREGLTNALSHAADHLVANQRRVHDGSEVINDDIADDIGFAGQFVNLDFGNMAAIWIGKGLYGEAGFGIEALCKVFRQLAKATRAMGKFQYPDLAVCSGNRKFSILGGEFDIHCCRLQKMTGKFLAFINHFVACGMNGRPLCRQGTGPAGAATGLDLVRVPLNHIDTLKRNTKPLSDDLGIGRGVSLSGRLCADSERNAIVILEADSRILGRIACCCFDKIAHADPAAFAILCRFRLASGKVGPARCFKRTIHDPLKLAAIIDAARCRLVGDGSHGYKVFSADFILSDAEFPGSLVHQPLDDIDRFGPSCATIGVDRYCIGENTCAMVIEIGDVIDARHNLYGGHGWYQWPECREIGAQIGICFHHHAGDLVVGIKREFGVGDMIAPLRVGEERITSLSHPFNRAPELS